MAKLNLEQSPARGDEVISTVGERLLANLRSGARVARIGAGFLAYWTAPSVSADEAKEVVRAANVGPTIASGDSVDLRMGVAVGSGAEVIDAMNRLFYGPRPQVGEIVNLSGPVNS